MGQRGPARRPTALRALEGRVSHRALNRGEPKPRSTTPVCPDFLPELARVEWDRIVEEMGQVPNWLAATDMATLAAYCLSFSRWRQAEEAITEHGQTYLAITTQIDTTGTPVDRVRVMARPEVAIARNEKVALKAFIRELGLSPSSRTAVNTRAGNDDERRDLDAV